MSWSVNGTLPGKDIQSFKELALGQNPECGDQFDAAATAMQSLIDSGTVGGTEKQFSFTMVGHANPNHEPREGWANDTIYISVSQI